MRCLQNLKYGFLSVFLIILLSTHLSAMGDQPDLNDPLLTTEQKLNLCLSQREKLLSELSEAKVKAAKNEKDLIEKVGFVAVGSALAYTGFNPIGLVAAGWFIVFN